MTFAYINPFIFGTVASYASVPYWENFNARPIFALNNTAVSSVVLQKVTVSVAVPWNKPIVWAMNDQTNSAIPYGTISLGLYTKTGATLSLLNSASQSMSGTTTVPWGSWFTMVTSAASTISAGVYYLGWVASAGTASVSLDYGKAVGNGGQSTSSAASLQGNVTVGTSSLPGSIATSDVTWVLSLENNPLYTIISA